MRIWLGMALAGAFWVASAAGAQVTPGSGGGGSSATPGESTSASPCPSGAGSGHSGCDRPVGRAYGRKPAGASGPQRIGGRVQPARHRAHHRAHRVRHHHHHHHHHSRHR